jgi:hypothetical protein
MTLNRLFYLDGGNYFHMSQHAAERTRLDRE